MPWEPVVDEFELFPFAVFFLPAKVQELHWSGEKFFHERSGQEIGKGFHAEGSTKQHRETTLGAPH
jgi:hypothetical protein